MLRNVSELRSHVLLAKDGDIWHCEDFILDDTPWSFRHIVVDTRNWLPGRKVLIPPQWVTGIDWLHKTVSVDQDKERIRESPEYDPHNGVSLEYEARLSDYYARPRGEGSYHADRI